MTENLYHHLKRLTKKEKAVLCRVLQLRWEHCHLGTLPFMNYEESLKWFGDWMVDNELTYDFHRQLYSKLRNSPKEGEVVNLLDAKVFQRFGKHPERGVFIPTLPTYHRKRARKMFERKKDAYDVCQHIVSLKHVGHNRWYVSCPKHLYPQVHRWLHINLE